MWLVEAFLFRRFLIQTRWVFLEDSVVDGFKKGSLVSSIDPPEFWAYFFRDSYHSLAQARGLALKCNTQFLEGATAHVYPTDSVRQLQSRKVYQDLTIKCNACSFGLCDS